MLRRAVRPGGDAVVHHAALTAGSDLGIRQDTRLSIVGNFELAHVCSTMIPGNMAFSGKTSVCVSGGGPFWCHQRHRARHGAGL